MLHIYGVGAIYEEFIFYKFVEFQVNWKIFCIAEIFNTYIYFALALILQNNLYRFILQEYKIKRWFCTQKPVLNVRFKTSVIQKKSEPKYL